MTAPVPRCTQRTVSGRDRRVRARAANTAYVPSTAGSTHEITSTISRNPPTLRRLSSTTVGSTARKNTMVLGLPSVRASVPANSCSGRSRRGACATSSGPAGVVHSRHARYRRYAAPAYRTTTNTVWAVCASSASPVAASVNQIRSPARKPAMNAGAPLTPRPRARATTAATPGPGEATASAYTRQKTDSPEADMLEILARARPARPPQRPEPPDQNRQHEERHECRGGEAPQDYARHRPLNLPARLAGPQRERQQTQRRHQCGHENRHEPLARSAQHGRQRPLCTLHRHQVPDVRNQEDGIARGDAEQRDESDQAADGVWAGGARTAEHPPHAR